MMDITTATTGMQPRTTGALGPDVLQARIRQCPEDFLVEEIPGFEASGQGEHALIWVEKRNANTTWVASQLARWAGVSERAVGYAGKKDRHAVTRQRFSIHLPGRELPDPDSFDLPDVRLLSATRHQRKLPRGALWGNRFVLRLRALQGDREAIDERLQVLSQRGMPNGFGAQRFGHGGRNLELARQLFAGRRLRRDQRSMALSAARSHLFNRVLAERIRRQSWDRALPGDVFQLEGSHSLFGPEVLDETLRRRLENLDIHPTGPLCGAGQSRAEDEAAALEHGVIAQYPELAAGLAACDLKPARRALRVRVHGLQREWLDGDLQLSFALPAGSFATVLLDMLGPVEDAASAAFRPDHGP